MAETVLVTGGAGFIGRSVCRELLDRGHKVRVLDALIEQVHGEVDGSKMLADDVELIVGDVRNGDVVAKALNGVDSVINLAAEVGVEAPLAQLALRDFAASLGVPHQPGEDDT